MDIKKVYEMRKILILIVIAVLGLLLSACSAQMQADGKTIAAGASKIAVEVVAPAIPAGTAINTAASNKIAEVKQSIEAVKTSYSDLTDASLISFSSIEGDQLHLKVVYFHYTENLSVTIQKNGVATKIVPDWKKQKDQESDLEYYEAFLKLTPDITGIYFPAEFKIFKAIPLSSDGVRFELSQANNGWYRP
jgi:predicted small secreted protein/phosphopantetheine adenylyltransferase